MNRYLVTGGLGFIGSSLVRLLRQRDPNAAVVVLDKLTYAADAAHLDGVACDVVNGDICDPRTVRQCRADVVFHLAAETHVDRSIVDAAPFARTNVVGTQVLLDAAVDWRVRLFVHISTDEIYGSGGPFREDAPPRPRNPYAASKAGAEHLVAAYAITHGLATVVTRCCNNYGPRQNEEKLIPRAVHNLLQGKPVPVYGDGLHRREWIHVRDHCEALWLLSQKGTPGRAYNVTSGVSLANLDLVKRLIALVGGGTYQHVTDRPGHDRLYALDGQRLAELGWQTTVTLEDGLKETVAYYRERLKVIGRQR